MGKAYQKITKTRRKKTSESREYIQCNVCKGTGKIKNWHKTKNK